MSYIEGWDTFGNTNAISSNFPLLLQFSAIGDLMTVKNAKDLEAKCFTILRH